MSQALGWQIHTTRAVISRLGKSGHVVVRTKTEAGQSVYRIEPGWQPNQEPPGESS